MKNQQQQQQTTTTATTTNQLNNHKIKKTISSLAVAVKLNKQINR